MARKKVSTDNGDGYEQNDASTEPGQAIVADILKQEEKHASFSRLASIRVSRALDALNALGKLSNKTSYFWTLEDRDKIFEALNNKMFEVQDKFLRADAPKEEKQKGTKQLSFVL